MTSRELTTADASLPAIDLNRPASMLSLPGWLGQRLHEVSTWEAWNGTPRLPSQLTLTGSQRRLIELRCSELDRAVMPGPEDKTAKAVGTLLGFYAVGKSSESQTALQVAIYLDALSDVPAWAVAEAVRRWFRGECGDHDTSFKPAPAVLRTAALDIAKAAKGQAVALRRLLAAEPVVELSTEERGQALERFGGIIRGVLEGGQ